MKQFYLLMFVLVSSTNSFCQNNDSVVVATGPIIICSTYCLTSDKDIARFKKEREDFYCTYPLLILNNVIIRDEKKVNCFRNRIQDANIKSTKRITKAEAEKKGIPNVPKDGVVFVMTKNGYYFDFSCE